MKIGIVGCGYIGLNTSLFYAKKGAKVVGCDVDKNKINILKEGKLPIKELNLWLTFETEPLIKKYMSFSTDIKNITEDKDIDVIFIAIPTEKNGEPYFDALENVINSITNSKNKNKLVIIESTLMPGVSDNYVAPYIKNFAVAPRRDWLGFEEPGRTLQNLPRIVGGNSEENTKKAIEILSIVCDQLHPCYYKESELVKAVENSTRHVGSVYAQELAWAYPELDTRKILKLASTKWNVPYYYPNALGTSGYCIPLSSRYVVKASKNKDALTIAKNTISTDDSRAFEIAQKIKDNYPNAKIGILGISYLGNIKVHILSGAMRFLANFKDRHNIYVHDPLYSEEEIKTITQCNYLDYPEKLKDMDIVMLTAGHDYYTYTDIDKLIEHTKKSKFVFDNTGIWESVDFKCKYILPGKPNWLLDMGDR